jgi:hypothetical protein
VNETTLLEEYGDEVMFSGWNPQVAAAVEQSLAVIDKHVILLGGLASVDVDSFLQNIYEHQC